MKYIALAVVAFAAGAELGLTKDQASARRHALTDHPKRKGWYVATGPVQLKAGEEFQHDGDLPKGMADALEAQQKAKASKADAEAAAKAEAIAAAEKAVPMPKPCWPLPLTTLPRDAAQQELDNAQAALQAAKA